MKKLFNKLVRDDIPEIIAKNGKTVTFHTVKDNDEFKAMLRRKLIEEIDEFINAETHEEVVDELADIYEVLEAIKLKYDTSDTEVNGRMNTKRVIKGGFGFGYVLDSVED